MPRDHKSSEPELHQAVYSNRRKVRVPELALRTIISYLWDDEKKNYEESGKPKGHIFEHLEKLELST